MDTERDRHRGRWCERSREEKVAVYKARRGAWDRLILVASEGVSLAHTASGHQGWKQHVSIV